MNNICTWIYLDEIGKESVFPQTGLLSSTQKHQNVYWKCVVVFFISSKRYNKEARHILYTNAKTIPVVEGVNIAAILDQLGVEIIGVPFNHRTPKDYYHAFQNQFYVFSIFEKIAAANQDGMYLILDSDCFFLKNIDDLFSKAQLNDGFAAIYDDVESDYKINGLSSLDLKEIFEELTGIPVSAPPRYYLGEFFLADLENIKKINEEFRTLFPVLLDRNRKGLPQFNEEAHTLSFLYHKLSFPADGVQVPLRRLWTNPVFYRHVDQEDISLSIWHLPSEKRFGFNYLFKFLTGKANNYGLEIKEESFKKIVQYAFSVPKLTTSRRLIFYVISYQRALTKRLYNIPVFISLRVRPLTEGRLPQID